MTLRLGDTVPDFEAETTEGKVKFHDWTYLRTTKLPAKS